MATYPGSVFAPATINNGDVIDAGTENTQNAEITAIEDALKNGIPHALTISTGGVTVSTGGLRVGGPSTLAALTAAASTLATLQAGNSTVTGTLDISGNATVGGTLTVGGIQVGGRQPSAKVSLAAATVSINSATWTAFNWTVNDHDSTSLHSTTTNSSRINLTSSGLWLIGGEVTWAPGTPASTTLIGARVLVNDNQCLVGQQMLMGTPSATAWPISVSGLYYATDTTAYVTLQALQTSGAGMNATGSTGGGIGPTHAWAQKVSA